MIRWETELNSAIPGDDRDTTTPKAMSQSVQILVLDDALAGEERRLLQNWLKACATCNDGVKVGVPSVWVVGGKTGSGSFGTSNEVAVLWPTDGPPIIIAVYFTGFEQGTPVNKAVIADVARLLVGKLY